MRIDMLLTGTGRILSWLGIVLVVPWATFAIIGRVAKFESNAAGGRTGIRSKLGW